MSLPTSHRAYVDCFDVLDKAIEDDLGVRVKFETSEEATHFRLRCHNARKLMRQMNTKIYQDGHPMHGASPYDHLVIKVHSDGWLYVEKVTVLAQEIVPLSKGEPEPEPVEMPLRPTSRRF